MKRALQFLRILILVLTALAAAPAVRAQQVVRLLEFTNVWKFNDTGADLGTAWRESGYGRQDRGLFGVESNLPPPYPIAIQTPMGLGNSPVITYYYRTHFQYGGQLTTTGTVLRARISVDDGCAVYLNGIEAGRVRLVANQDYLTLAATRAGGSNPEGVLDTFEFSPDLLVNGDNVLAVEVHQSQVGSSDVVFGMRLDGQIPQTLAITRQPEDQSVTIPFSGLNSPTPAAFFRVDVTGGPASYQWLKDGTNLPNAQTAFLTIAAPTFTNAGAYSVIVSNALGTVTSSNATLALAEQVPAGSGLKLLTARPQTINLLTTNIHIVVSKQLNLTSARDIRNYSVRILGTTNDIPVTGVAYNYPTVRISVATPLQFGTDYYVTVNGLRDISGNNIAPNSQIGVSWTIITNLVADLWHYHAFATQDVSILDAKWYEPGYVESEYWQQGLAGFDTRMGISNCVGIARTVIPYQKQAMLYRVPFVWAGDTESVLQVSLKVSSVPFPVVWLNGEEIYRYNIGSDFPALPTPVDVNTRSYRSSGVGLCSPGSGLLLPSAKLQPGTNWLAAGVFQFADGPAQTGLSTGPSGFGATLEVSYLHTGAVPESPPPHLAASSLTPDQFQLSWTGAGYALETTTNITSVGTNTVVGPWLVVPDMTNPYTVTVNSNEPLRLFKLTK